MAVFVPRPYGYGSDLLKDTSVRVDSYESRMFDAADKLIASKNESDQTKKNVLYMTQSIVECRDLCEFLSSMRKCVRTIPMDILLPVLFEGTDYYLQRIGKNDEETLRGLFNQMKTGTFSNFENVIGGLEASVRVVIKININVLKFPCKKYFIHAP